MASDHISAVVVDDHPMFRSGLIQALTTDQDFVVVGEGGSAAEAVELVRNLHPDVLLLDAWMEASSIARVPEILSGHPDVKIVVVTASQDQDDVSRALKAGVCGYVLKGTTASEMRGIIRMILAGESFVSREVMGGLWSAARSSLVEECVSGAALTKREEHVVRLMTQGLNNREIGQKLSITEKTVKFHMSGVFRKLGVRNRVEASNKARGMWSDLSHSLGST